MVRLLLGRFKTALKVANELLDKDAGDWEIYMLLADIKANEGQPLEAEKYLEEAMKINESRRVVLKLGKVYIQNGHPFKAQ